MKNINIYIYIYIHVYIFASIIAIFIVWVNTRRHHYFRFCFFFFNGHVGVELRSVEVAALRPRETTEASSRTQILAAHI